MIKENHIDTSDALNLSESGLRIAFEVTSLDGKVGKYDPRYVKYLFRMWYKGRKDSSQAVLNYHPCT